MITIILTCLLACMTAIGFFRLWWWCVILDFFRLQYSVLALILAGFSFSQRDFVFVSINLLVMGINLLRIRRFLLPQTWFRRPAANQIYAINAYRKNHDPTRLKRLLHNFAPELVLLMEMTTALEESLAPIINKYHRLQTPVRDGFSICLLSKNPLSEARIEKYGASETPLLIARTSIQGTIYQIYSAHPKPALNREWSQDRLAYFTEIEKQILSSSLPIIMLGDFNSAPWEPHFNRFLRRCNLKSTVEGYGYQLTWPVYFPFLGVPMDHILISKNLVYRNFRAGPYVGSDHYPISIAL